jgi:hypothetical protein
VAPPLTSPAGGVEPIFLSTVAAVYPTVLAGTVTSNFGLSFPTAAF